MLLGAGNDYSTSNSICWDNNIVTKELLPHCCTDNGVINNNNFSLLQANNCASMIIYQIPNNLPPCRIIETSNIPVENIAIVVTNH